MKGATNVCKKFFILAGLYVFLLILCTLPQAVAKESPARADHQILLTTADKAISVRPDGSFTIHVKLLNSGKTPWTISKDFHGLPTIISWSLAKGGVTITCAPLSHTMEYVGPSSIKAGKFLEADMRLDLRDFEGQPSAGEWLLRAHLQDGTLSEGLKIKVTSK
jgi:hypothetical protein